MRGGLTYVIVHPFVLSTVNPPNKLNICTVSNWQSLCLVVCVYLRHSISHEYVNSCWKYTVTVLHMLSYWTVSVHVSFESPFIEIIGFIKKTSVPSSLFPLQYSWLFPIAGQWHRGQCCQHQYSSTQHLSPVP
jgi:hypothetical protein